MRSNSKLILILILAAFIVRVLVLWIERPEFVGWFNHTYYYYVQTRGLLENGALPFPDMPLLFYIYAGTAKLFTWLGIEFNTAIVSATRFWMCLIPSLLPIPVYLTFKRIYNNQTLPNWTWVFFIISAFYPLSILNMPEFLQKNVLGLFLLAILTQQSIAVVEDQNIKRYYLIVFAFLLIVLTHFGSTAVALLYLAALIISFLIHKRKALTPRLAITLTLGLGLSLLIFYILDTQRFDRIGYYFNRILDNSSIALLFSPDYLEKFISLCTIIVPLGFTLLFYKWFKKIKEDLNYEHSVFWLANIIFCYLLVLPIYDPTLLSRFILFLTLPLMYVLAFTIQHTITKQWAKKVVLGLVLFGTLAIASASISTLFFLNQDKEEVYQDLMTMKHSIEFNNNDLIVTRHGVEHISNWFLGTKSCVITSFNENDLQKYDRVFILNPTKKGLSLASESDEASIKYHHMGNNIQEPRDANVVYESMHIKLLEMEAVPSEWIFDSTGTWVGNTK